MRTKLQLIALVIFTALSPLTTSADHESDLHPKILWNVKAHPPASEPWTAAVPAVEFSPDGERIISAGFDGTIKFLNRSNGAETMTILAHTGAVHAISISKDGRMLSSGGADRMLNLWRVSDGTLLRSMNAHTTAVYSVAFSPDASLVLSVGGLDNQLKIWRTTDGGLVRTIQGRWGATQQSAGGMLSAAFAPNGQYIASSGLEIWNLDGTLFRDLGYLEARTQVKFTPDSTRVFATVPYAMVGYNLVDGTPVQPWSTSSFPQSAVSPDGRSVLSISVGLTELVWSVVPSRGWWLEPNSGQIYSHRCLDSECSLALSSIAFDPRMRTVAAGLVSGEVLCFELPIWISGIQRNGNQLNLQWQGGSGNYQLQKLTPSGTWEDLGSPLTDNAASVPLDSSSAFLRVRNAGP